MKKERGFLTGLSDSYSFHISVHLQSGKSPFDLSCFDVLILPYLLCVSASEKSLFLSPQREGKNSRSEKGKRHPLKRTKSCTKNGKKTSGSLTYTSSNFCVPSVRKGEKKPWKNRTHTLTRSPQIFALQSARLYFWPFSLSLAWRPWPRKREASLLTSCWKCELRPGQTNVGFPTSSPLFGRFSFAFFRVPPLLNPPSSSIDSRVLRVQKMKAKEFSSKGH